MGVSENQLFILFEYFVVVFDHYLQLSLIPDGTGGS